MSNPEFQMQGISFVVSSPSGPSHALPFKLRLANGHRIEMQGKLAESFTIFDVIAELRRLAADLEIATAPVGRLDFPAAVAGPTLHSAPVDSKPPLPK